MGRLAWNRWLAIGGVLGVLGTVWTAPASAEDEEVARRLAKYGKLSSAEAHKLVAAVSSRMKQAADMSSTNDPVRVAVSNALYGSGAPGDAMAAAKVRLRLYAGLNDWALNSLFSPRPGAMATCTSQFGLKSGDCGALLAASGRMSPAQASRVGGGAPLIAAPAPATRGYARPAQQPAARPPQAGGYGNANAGQRFGQYNTNTAYRGAQPGYGGAQQPAYGAQPGYGYGARPAYAPQQQQGYGYGAQPPRQPAPAPAYGAQRPAPAYGAARPAPAQPAYGARPGYGAPAGGYGYGAAQPQRAAVARPVGPPPPSAATVASRKAEYARKRQEYLERKKQEMASRKAKVVATAGGTERVQRGPASIAEAEAAGLDASEVAKPEANAPMASKSAAKAPAKAAAAKPGAEPAAAPEEVAEASEPPKKAGGKPALDTGFLDGLMDDPLGKTK